MSKGADVWLFGLGDICCSALYDVWSVQNQLTKQQTNIGYQVSGQGNSPPPVH
jgi:hypothetical protein